MRNFLIEGKRNITLFEIWGGLGNHYQALISLGYIILPDRHYLYYENEFNLEPYRVIHGKVSMPKHLISSETSLKNISLARFNTDGILIWKHMDVMSIGNSNSFYKDENHLQILRLVEECKVKFLVFESKEFEKDETKKVDILKDFIKKMSNLGYRIKEIQMENYEYFSLLKQNKPHLVFYLPDFVFFDNNLLEKKTEHHYFFARQENFLLKRAVAPSCFLRIYKKKKYLQFNTVYEQINTFTYVPLDKNELPIIFRPKGMARYTVNKVNNYISEVNKWYDQKERKFKYTRPKIGFIVKRKTTYLDWLRVVQIPLRELLLQYGFFSEPAYIQKIGHLDDLREYIKDEENEWKFIKSLANSSSVNVLKYIYSSVFIYVNKKEVSYAKEHREQYQDIREKDH